MKDVHEFLQRCAAKEKDEAAWAELWQLVAGAAEYVIRQQLVIHRIRNDRIVDVLQDLYLYLQENACARLEAFRGTTEAELRVYMRQVALRFAASWIHKEEQACMHAAETLQAVGPPVRDGPTEEQIESIRRELESIMTASEREKLHAVSGQDTPCPDGREPSAPTAKPDSERTIRRWREQLLRVYGDRIY